MCLILIQYVDNSGIRYNCRELVDEFYAAVRDDGRIELNFVGELTWWLGVRCTYSLVTGAINDDQEAFIDQLLEQYAMPNCNPCVLPMAVGADLASIPMPDVPDKDMVATYHKLVGELLNICINTVPGIMYTLTRYLTRATSQHYGYAKQVLRYLKGVTSISSSRGVRKPSKPRFSDTSFFASPMPAGPRQVFAQQHAVLRQSCAATERLSHRNRPLLPSSLSPRVSSVPNSPRSFR
jgi:hypothetical protein